MICFEQFKVKEVVLSVLNPMPEEALSFHFYPLGCHPEAIMLGHRASFLEDEKTFGKS